MAGQEYKTKYNMDNTTVQKLKGQYFTEDHVAEFMCKIGLWSYLTRNIKGIDSNDYLSLSALYRVVFHNELAILPDYIWEDLIDLLLEVKVFDPAVGEGIFLTKMLELLESIIGMLEPIIKMPGEARALRERFIKFSLYGIDINLEAVKKCRENLQAHMGKANQERIGCNIRHGDSLLEDNYIDAFDIVICNPPYVRPETLPKLYKDQLSKKYPEFERRSDLYVYFFPGIYSSLKQNGVCVIITPLSWMDVNYGSKLKNFVLKNMPIRTVFYSDVEKWFPEASVNTSISLFHKGGKHEKVAFVTFKKQIMSDVLTDRKYGENVLKGLVIPELSREKDKMTSANESIDKYDNNYIKVTKVGQHLLSNSSGQKRDIKWTRYLRAPESYYTLQNHLKNKGVYLGDIATITRGYTTGCNEFFFFKETFLADERQTQELASSDDMEQSGIIHKYVKVCKKQANDQSREFLIETTFLQPLIKTPRELQTYSIRRDLLTHKVLTIHLDSLDDLKESRVLDYIEWGQEMGFHLRNTCKSRDMWFALPSLPPADVLLRQFYDTRFNLPINEFHFPVDHTFYYVTGCENPKLLGAILNSTISYLFIELEGRINQSDGVLTCYGPEFNGLLVPSPEVFNKNTVSELVSIFNRMCKRKAVSIFDEIKCKDRVALDDVVLKAIGVKGKKHRKLLMAELYNDISMLVRKRVERNKK